MEFGDKLKLLMKDNNLTHKKLAEELNLGASTISSYVTNARQPNFEILMQIAKYFNVDANYLLGSNVEPVHLSEDVVKIPVLGCVSCGKMSLAEENIIDYIDIPREWQNKGQYFALKLKGNSMSPKFLNGDIVVFKKQSIVDSGELAIVCIDDESEATFKKVMIDKNKITLIALNPEYDPIYLDNKKRVRILGVPVELRRKDF